MERLVKCPVCNGSGEYILIQNWEGKEYKTPVKCTHCVEGKIQWAAYCTIYRRNHRRAGKKNV